MSAFLLGSISDSIISFFSEMSDITHFVNRIWHFFSGFFEGLSRFFAPGLGAIEAVIETFDSVFQAASFVTSLVPGFLYPWITIFLSVTIGALAVSIILELL